MISPFECIKDNSLKMKNYFPLTCLSKEWECNIANSIFSDGVNNRHKNYCIIY